MTRLLSAFCAASWLSISGCGDELPLTELMIAVDTDMDVPVELDSVRIDVVGPAGEIRRTTGVLDRAERLPVLLGVVHRGGPLGPVLITVTGRLADEDVVQRRAIVDFVQDEVKVLPLYLSRSCVGVRCEGEQTCEAASCRAQRVDPRELEEWDGSVGRRDGGVPTDDAGPDAAVCHPVPETCNDADDDCDEEIDEVFDLARDPLNCGTCGHVCALDPPNATGTCVDGECSFVCDPDWADCGGETDGCETSLVEPATCGDCDAPCSGGLCAEVDDANECVASCPSGTTDCSGTCADTDASPRHCGACGTACTAPPGAAATCESGTCGFRCDSGLADCDGEAGNGCESRLREMEHCGACGVRCAPPDAIAACITGACEIVACEGSHADCNGASDDGCETDIAASATSCGRCGNACPEDPPHASARCAEGACSLACGAGYADCNGDANDGCEATLGSTATCGSCGIRCDGSTPVCSGRPSTGFACAADCDGSGLRLCSGSCVDTEEDPSHCGGCGARCVETPRSSVRCVSGACEAECDPGYADCNEMPEDGCEARLETVSHCGGCNVRCSLPSATPACVMNACVIASCAAGHEDCDGSADNGCEQDTMSDPDHCGDCDTVCASGSCTDGMCDPVVPDAGMPDGGV